MEAKCKLSHMHSEIFQMKRTQLFFSSCLSGIALNIHISLITLGCLFENTY